MTRALRAVGLYEVRDQKVRTFSKGHEGRLSLAQALAGIASHNLLGRTRPSGQDPLARVAIRDLMLRHREAGGTVFLNSHILSDVERVCDRVAISSKTPAGEPWLREELERGGDRLYVEAAGLADGVEEALAGGGQGLAAGGGGLDHRGGGAGRDPRRWPGCWWSGARRSSPCSPSSKPWRTISSRW